MPHRAPIVRNRAKPRDGPGLAAAPVNMNSLPTQPELRPTSLVQDVVDRRLSARARLATTVTLTLGDRLVEAFGSEISDGGIRLVARTAARAGEPASLVFFLNGDIVSARGRVRWCNPTKRGLFTMGIEFLVVEDDGAALIASFCRNSIS